MRQRYGWRWAARAAHDTAEFLSVRAALVIALIGAAGAYVVSAVVWPDVVASVVPGAFVALVGLLAAFGVVFLLFLVLAPARMERDECAENARERQMTSSAIAALTQERDEYRQAFDDRAIQRELVRRGAVLAQLRNLYVLSHDGISAEMAAGLAPLPKEWVEGKLSKMGETWRQNEYR